MMISLDAVFPIILYLCLIVLVIVFIVLGIKLIRILDKADIVLDEMSRKMNQVDGVFNIIDRTTSYANTIGDRIIDTIASFISNLFKKKKGNDEDE